MLVKLVNVLNELHGTENHIPDEFSRKKAYYRKTMERIHSVRDLIPFTDRKIICVNGRDCRNVFFYKHDLERKLVMIPCQGFCLIHGDCTFSKSNAVRKWGTHHDRPKGIFWISGVVW